VESIDAAVARARAAGKVLGPFVLLAELGRGAMGVVHRAWDERTSRLVALKLLDPTLATPEAVDRLGREVTASAALDHPGIVPALDAGVAAGRPYVAFALVDGASMDRRLARGDLDVRGAARALRDVARALAHAHDRGVVHRDLKPANILIEAQGAAKVIDFGLASMAHHARRLTASGAILGTPAFMAPEQAGGQSHTAGPPADVWALGATLFLALTGRPPFQGASFVDLMGAILERSPPSPSSLAPDVDPDLEALALACLRKPPDRRPSAAEVAHALDVWLRPRRRTTVPAARRRPLARAAAGAAAALALASVGAVWLLHRSAAPHPAPAPPGPASAPAPGEPGPPGPGSAPPPTDPPPAPAPGEPRPAPPRPATEAGLASREEVDDVLGRASAARARGDLRAAPTIYDEAVARRPEELLFVTGRSDVRAALGDPAAALADAERAVALGPDDPTPYLVRARRRSHRGDNPGALADLDRAVALSRDVTSAVAALLQRAGALRRAGHLEACRASAGEALRLIEAAPLPQTMSLDRLARAERALATLGLGRRQEAWAECAPLHDPADPERSRAVAVPVARCAVAVGELELAESLLAGEAAEDPSSALARGELALARRRLEEAEVHLSAATRYSPGDVTAWLVLANARLYRRGAEALGAAREAVRLAPDDPRAWVALSMALTVAREGFEAAAAVDRAVALDPEHRVAPGQRAQALLAVGDLPRACAASAAHAAAEPGESTWLSLAILLARAGDGAGARDALGRFAPRPEHAGHVLAWAELFVRERAPAPEVVEGLLEQLARQRFPDGLVLGALWRLRRGEARRALDDCEAVLAMNEALGRSPLPASARARLRLGDVARAEDDADRAVLLRPRSSEAFAARSEVRLAKGDLAAASADARRAVELDPRDPAGYALRGRCRLRAGEPDGAADLRRAAELDPGLGPDVEAWLRDP
jgi:tetratricopeptide (TPR) repeat protein